MKDCTADAEPLCAAKPSIAAVEGVMAGLPWAIAMMAAKTNTAKSCLKMPRVDFLMIEWAKKAFF